MTDDNPYTDPFKDELTSEVQRVLSEHEGEGTRGQAEAIVPYLMEMMKLAIEQTKNAVDAVLLANELPPMPVLMQQAAAKAPKKEEPVN